METEAIAPSPSQSDDESLRRGASPEGGLIHSPSWQADEERAGLPSHTLAVPLSTHSHPYKHCGRVYPQHRLA